MTEHLPECPNHCIDVPADYMAKNVYMRRCICAALRACEERVLDAAEAIARKCDAAFTAEAIRALKEKP